MARDLVEQFARNHAGAGFDEDCFAEVPIELGVYDGDQPVPEELETLAVTDPYFDEIETEDEDKEKPARCRKKKQKRGK